MRKNVILLVLVLCLVTVSCDQTKHVPGSIEEVCAASISGIDELKKVLGVPEHFMKENPTKWEGDFDPNSYFNVLTHLSIQRGYTLDYVYNNYSMGGNPIIYARPTNQEPYATYIDFKNAMEDTSNAYMDYIQTDDTPEGYLQFVILATLGDQFYLYWHANYYDIIFMCASTDIDKTIAEVNANVSGSFDNKIFEETIAAEAETIDFKPTVELDEETATVRFVYFTKWGGFIEVWYKITRDFPHKIFEMDTRVLIEYDCGLRF